MSINLWVALVLRFQFIVATQAIVPQIRVRIKGAEHQKSERGRYTRNRFMKHETRTFLEDLDYKHSEMVLEMFQNKFVVAYAQPFPPRIAMTVVSGSSMKLSRSKHRSVFNLMR